MALFNADFWVLISFLGFVGLVFYFKVPARVISALDDRSAAIAHELEEAQKLREEAQRILAQHQRRQQDETKEINNILEQAHAEAERLAMEIRSAMIQRMERRTKMAEDKIKQAERHALADIHALVASTTIDATKDIVEKKMSSDQTDAYINEGAQELRSALR
ncbi:MAG: hypothetical protein V6Z81_01380 [Parvularculales bacterium]